MIKKILLSLLCILPGCVSFHATQTTQSPQYITVGSQDATQTWIYLCGLTNNFNQQQMNELTTLNTLGKELNIKILAVIPHHRCPQYNNFLCWPHDTKNELLQTYQEIIDIAHTHKVDGYIGFSNGGFFLIQLAQHVALNTPIIIIGAAGKINNTQGPLNTINLLIGKKDTWHYEHAINLYKQSKNTNLTINLIEYDNGHEIPLKTLKNVLTNVIQHKEI
jgi:hypothetical protein